MVTNQPIHIPTLVDNHLHLITAELIAVRAAIKSLKEKEDALVERLKSIVMDVEEGKVTIVNEEDGRILPRFQVQLVNGSNSQIKREKLLERGVGPDIIDYATNRTTFISLRTKEIQDENESENR